MVCVRVHGVASLGYVWTLSWHRGRGGPGTLWADSRPRLGSCYLLRLCVSYPRRPDHKGPVWVPGAPGRQGPARAGLRAGSEAAWQRAGTPQPPAGSEATWQRAGTPPPAPPARPYLHLHVLPGVQAHGLDLADVGDVPVNPRAAQTDEHPQGVRGPVRICKTRPAVMGVSPETGVLDPGPQACTPTPLSGLRFLAGAMRGGQDTRCEGDRTPGSRGLRAPSRGPGHPHKGPAPVVPGTPPSC